MTHESLTAGFEEEQCLINLLGSDVEIRTDEGLTEGRCRTITIPGKAS